MAKTKRRSVRPETKAWSYGLAGILGVIVVCGATPPPERPQSSPGTSAPSSPAPTAIQQTAAAIPADAHPMDQPLRLIQAAQQTFAGVRTYSCTMIKQERIQGQLQAPNVVSVTVRNQPFAIYMKWHEPRDLAGQEACYAAGRNNGMMRVKSTGFLGAVGFVSLDTNDARTRKTSNHSITEAGIGNLINRFAQRWQQEKQQARPTCQVRIGEYEYNKRRCTRVETITPVRGQGTSPYYRSVVYFDKEHHLPIRVEAYDWPRQVGNPAGELVEVYNYVNLQFNGNVPDQTFQH